MKKLLFVLAFVAIYGVSMAMSSTNVVMENDAQVTIVADMGDNNAITVEGEKKEEKKAAKTETKTSTDAKAKGEGCGEAKSEAKSEGCGGEAKKECGSKK